MDNKTLYKIKKYFTLDGYSMAPLYVQLGVLILISTLIVLAFSLIHNSLEASYLLFMDPTALPENSNVLLSFIQLMLGLIIASFVISILSSALENSIENIKSGILPYKGKNHLLFINSNKKLFYILEELDIKYSDSNTVQEIVVLVSTKEAVESIVENLGEYKHLAIYVKQGDLLDANIYKNMNISKTIAVDILADENIEDPFLSDNMNIKILSTLMNDEKFVDSLEVRNNKHKNITVETRNSIEATKIINSIATVDGIDCVAVVNSDKLLSQILNRSIIDIIYYKIYSEMFTFEGSEIYLIDSNKYDFKDKGFKSLHKSFKDSLLIGFVRDEKVLLNPTDENVQKDDLLVVLSDDEDKIVYEHTDLSSKTFQKLEQPSEIVKRDVCMIGEYLKVDNIFDFLDEESKKRYKSYNFEDMNTYFTREFLENLISGNFDIVILNLDDEVAYRFAMYIISEYGLESKLVHNIVSIVSDPISANLINTTMKRQNVILSEKLSAQFISQLSFDSNLVNVINELTTSSGSEFNLIDSKDIGCSDVEELKEQLLQNDMTYIGVVQDNEILFNSQYIAQSSQVIVLSKGEN